MKILQKKGFTLIELLVVVAVIGILATVVVGQLGKARAKARVAKLEGDIHAMRKSLELYYIDHGVYPEPERTSIPELYRFESHVLIDGFDIAEESVFKKLEPYGFDLKSFKDSIVKLKDKRFGLLSIQYGLGKNALRSTCFDYTKSLTMGDNNYLIRITTRGSEDLVLNSEGVYTSGDVRAYCYVIK